MRPYGTTWWEWYIAPRITVIQWRLQRRCLACGQKRPHHKPDCAER